MGTKTGIENRFLVVTSPVLKSNLA